MANKTKIYFQKDTIPIITDILKNNQIEDSEDVFLKKLSLGKLLQGEVIFYAVEKILLENMPEKNVCSFLETELGADDKTSKRVYKDILAKLISIAKKQTFQETNKDKKEIIEEKQTLKGNTSQKVPENTKGYAEAKKINIPSPPKQSSEPDRYREPIG